MQCSLHSSCNTQTLSLVKRHSLDRCRCQWPENSRRAHTPRCSTELVAPLSNVVLTQLDQLPAPAITAEVTTQHDEQSRVGRTLRQPQKSQRVHDGQQHASSAVQPATATVNPHQPQAAAVNRQQQVLQQQMQQADAVQPDAVQPEQAVPQQLQQQDRQLAQQSSSKRSKRAKARAAAVAAAAAAGPPASEVLQEPQQELQKPARSHRRLHTQIPLRFQPCGRGGSLRHAAVISKHLSQGKQLLLPAGSGMQVARGVSALASARTLMLGYGSTTGLAFQPSFPAAAAAAQRQEVQQGRQQQEVQAQAQQGRQQEQQQGFRQQPDGESSSKQHGSSESGIMMFVSGLAEAQLRRFEQSPLIAARYGDPSVLAGAAFARVCQQGFTAVRAAGPDAVSVALAAVTHARRKLLGCGLDLAVVPLTEFVDVDSLTGADGQPAADNLGDEQQMEFGPGDEFGRQCVRVTVLHLMRCEPQQPWQLLPWPPAPEQQPAVRWPAEQLELQQRARLMQQQQAELQQQQQQQQQRQRTAAGKGSMRLQRLNGAVQPAAAGSTVAAAGVAGVTPVVGSAPPGSTGQARMLDVTTSSSSQGSGSGSDRFNNAWPGNAAEVVIEANEAEMLLPAPGYSHAPPPSMVLRQGASVLLQKQRKSKRQLVAAAQSAAHSSKGSCSSGSGSAAS